MKMQNLGKVWTAIILSCGLAFGAGVKATVNTVEVVKGNPVQLFLKATGGSTEFPKILMVGDAPVVGRSTSSSRNLTMVNGSVNSEQSTTKILQFVPQSDMTIPSYTVMIDGKEYKTNPIAIKVVKSSAPTAQNNSLFSLQMRANKTKVMVGESLMVTVYFSLKNGVRLSQDIQYTAPSFPGFIVADAGEQNAYIKDNYQVQEVRYLLTAQQEGNFTATPAHAKVGVADRSRRDIFGMSFGTKWRQTASNTLEIEVLAQAKESDLVGDFTVDTTIDAQEVKANKPVNLTVKIEGKGNLESFEFPKYEIDGVTVYSDEAKVETKVVDGELYSSYSKSFAFISEDDFSIPARSFSMLTPEDQQMKELNVNAYDVTIKKSSTSSVSLKPHTNGMVQTKITQPLPSQKEGVKKGVEVKSVAWWMLAVAFALGMLFMFVLKWMPRFTTRSTNPYKESEALKILYGHMSEDAQIEEMVRKLYARKNGDRDVQIDKKVLKEMVNRVKQS